MGVGMTTLSKTRCPTKQKCAWYQCKACAPRKPTPWHETCLSHTSVPRGRPTLGAKCLPQDKRGKPQNPNCEMRELTHGRNASFTPAATETRTFQKLAAPKLLPSFARPRIAAKTPAAAPTQGALAAVTDGLSHNGSLCASDSAFGSRARCASRPEMDGLPLGAPSARKGRWGRYAGRDSGTRALRTATRARRRWHDCVG